MARKRRSREGRPAVDEVLRGACSVDAAQLIGLINQVNPTGRGLAAAEQAHRYAQKSRLQALLIERFAGDLDVALDPAAPGAVSIRRRQFPGDACHAVLDQLDEDSRSWVRRRLDEAESPHTSSSTPAVRGGDQRGVTSRPPSPDPLAAGRRALEEYDYDSARALLAEALQRSGGAPDEATALLDLLVDHLADDDAALRLETALSAEARQSSRVRVLLALAAARTGDCDRARALIRGVSDSREVDVWAALARGALRDGVLDEAEECLARIQEIAPGCSEVPGLTGELARQRERKVDALVDATERAWSGAHHEEAERLAREVLSRCPGNARALAILEEIGEVLRSQELQELMDRAREAVEAARYQEAIDLWQRAARAGARDEEMTARIREAHRMLRRQREAGAVSEVVDLLARADLEPGLLAYHALAARLRARVRERVGLPLLSWLERVRVRGSRRQAPRDVAAVLALARALDLLDRDRWQEAASLLRPHAGTLGPLAEAGQCLQELAHRESQERQRQIDLALAAGEDALDQELLEHARSQLQRARELGIRQDVQARFSSLEARLEDAETRAAAAGEYERLLSGGRLLEARQALAMLQGEAHGSECVRWSREEDRLRKRIRAAWHLHQGSDFDGPLDWWLDRGYGYEGTGCWLLPGGASALLVRAEERSLFVLELDMSDGRPRRWTVLRTPEPLVYPSACVTGDGQLWLYGEQGKLLQLAAGTLEPLDWRSVPDLLPPDLIMEHAHFSPDARYLWCDTRTPHGGHGFGTSRLYVIDLHKNKVCHDTGEFGWITPLVGSARFQIADTSFEAEEITLYETGSGRSGARRMDLAGVARDVVVHPDGRRVVALLHEADDLDDPGRLLLQVLAEDGQVTAPWFLADHDGDAPHGMATSLADALTFVASGPASGGFELAALQFGPAGPRHVWRVPAPRNTVLLQDPGSQSVAALYFTRQGIHLSQLGRQPPDLPTDPEGNDPPLPDLEAFSGCGEPTGPAKARILALAGQLGSMPARDRETWEREYVREHGEDADAVWALARARRQTGDRRAAERLVGKTLRQHPRHAGLAVLAADLAKDAANWHRVRKLLDGCDAGEVDGATACHLHHLLGLALLMTGEPEEARSTFEDGLRYQEGADRDGQRYQDGANRDGLRYQDGACDLQPLIELLTPLPDPLQPADWDESCSTLRQLLGAVHVADTCLGNDDARGAIAAMDRPAVWRTRELQSTARLAEAFLAGPPPEDHGVLKMTVALAVFLDRHRLAEGRFRRELPIPGATWDRQTRDGLARRCRAWLESERR